MIVNAPFATKLTEKEWPNLMDQATCIHHFGEKRVTIMEQGFIASLGLQAM